MSPLRPEAPETKDNEIVRPKSDGSDKVPKWGVETWLLVMGTIASLVVGGGKLYVVADHVSQLEDWKAKQEDAMLQRHNEEEARFRSVEGNVQDVRASSNQSLAVFTQRLNDIDARLADIQASLKSRSK